MTTHEMTTRQVKEALRAGRFSSLGGYPLYFVTSDGAALCHGCARSEWRNVCDSIRTHANDGWRITGHQPTYEDASLYCDHCSERIESAYAEPEEE